MKQMWKVAAIALLPLAGCGIQGRNSGPADEFAGGVQQTEKLNFRVDTVLTGLDVPWSLTFLSGGDILFTERAGQLRLIRGGKLHPDPIGGLPKVRAEGQGGLLDIELHPDYASNGWIYLSYSAPAESGEEGKGGNTALMRARLKDHQLVDQQVLFKAKPNYPAAHHYGSRIEFDKEGYLYLSIGDRGGTYDNQTLSNYRGKVLRLKDDGTVPADNPYVGKAGANPEVFTWGHRNPQGMAMNPASGEIWENEHGPQGGDEVNILRKGNNYGWAAVTFGIDYDGGSISPDTTKPGLTLPITYWVPSIAPSGMQFVTSDRYPGWKGNMLVSSMKFRYLNRCELQGDKVTHQEKLIENIGRIRDIRQSPDGYIYLAVEGPGMIVRLVPE